MSYKREINFPKVLKKKKGGLGERAVRWKSRVGREVILRVCHKSRAYHFEER